MVMTPAMVKDHEHGTVRALAVQFALCFERVKQNVGHS
jgi:hypothetical protein